MVLGTDFNAAVRMLFWHYWFRTNYMGYVNCDSADELTKISLLEKKLSLLKEVAIFSIIIFLKKV